MLLYDENTRNYLDKRVEKIDIEINESIQKIRMFTNYFDKDSLSSFLTNKILNRIDKCIEELNANIDSSILQIANLRFLFETCITVKLLISEDDYKYKLRYSIYEQQINKSKALTNYSKVDKKLLKEMKLKENLIDIEYKDIFNEKNISLLDKRLLEKNKKIDSLYDNLDKEFSIFLEGTEYFGISLQEEHIDKYLKSHEERENNILDYWNNLKKELIKDSNFKKIFELSHQCSQIDKKLKDDRSWVTKAELVGLTKMYEFLYNYSSSFLHSTSYSLLVPEALLENEKIMIKNLSRKFIFDIIKNLKIFSSTPDNLTIIKG